MEPNESMIGESAASSRGGGFVSIIDSVFGQRDCVSREAGNFGHSISRFPAPDTFLSRSILSPYSDSPEPSKYITDHKDRLESRSDYLITSQLDDGKPYWAIGNVDKEKTEAKVEQQKIAKTVESAYLLSEADVSLDTGVDLGSRYLIPKRNVLFFDVPDDETAKRLTGLLNSTPAQVYVGSYTIRTGGRYCAHMAWATGIIPVPNEIFDNPSDIVTDIIEELHDQGGNDEISDELDKEVADMYGLSDSEMAAMNNFLYFFLDRW